MEQIETVIAALERAPEIPPAPSRGTLRQVVDGFADIRERVLPTGRIPFGFNSRE